MANRYSKALKHLKNKIIDEKLELLEALPTNNTAGLYTDVPGEFETPDAIQLLPRAADLAEDGDGSEGYTGNDTSGLFLEDGTILLVEPPGDTSYILGPMISMWYAWANYTQIGYVRQSDRRMVNLGRIVGELDDWDGESGFTGYGQMTVEQAAWYKNISRQDYRAFYPGPPSNPADEYGRYIGSIVSVPKPTTYQGPNFWSPGTQRGFNATDNFAAQVARGEVDIPEVPRGTAQYDLASELAMIGLSFAAVKLLMGAIAAGGALVQRQVADFIKVWRATGPQIPKVRPPQTPKVKPPKPASTPKFDPKKPGGGTEYQQAARNWQRQNPGKYNPYRSDSANRLMRQQGVGSQPNPNSAFRKPLSNSHDLQGTLLAEGIEELPVELIAVVNTIIAEIGNKPKSIDKLISLLEKYPKKKISTKSVKESKEVLSENRKRIFRDIKKPVQVKEMPTKVKVSPKLRNKNKTVGVDMMKVPDTPAQYKPQTNIWQRKDYRSNVRASQEKKNEVLELLGAAEHHWTYLTEDRRRQKQEKVNEMMAAEFDKQLELLYEKYKIKENKTSKIRSLLSDSNLVYDKLDPHSAEFMPPTGDPEIDANIKRATNAKEKARKLKILLGKKA